MSDHQSDPLHKAFEYWRGGKALEAGRLIFENLSPDIRPKWAARILRLVLEKSGAERTHFERLLYTADHPKQWANGHRCFDLLRDTTLELDELRKRHGLTEEQDTFQCIVALAELVAKVTYNAVDPPDPFDADSGWWIVSSLRAFVDWLKDEKFSQAAWSALICQQ